MKKILIAASLLGACAGAAHAQSNVTMYGVMDVMVDGGKNGADNVPRVQSGGIFGSRLGFKGSEDLGNGLSAIFLLEMGINADDGTSGQGGVLFGRQSWAGLSSTKLGTLTAGRQYPGYFLTLATYGLGGGMGWGNASNYFTDPIPLRVNNSIAYASPSINGLVFRGLYGFGENTALPGGTTLGSIHSGSVQYDKGPLSANLSYEHRKTTFNNSEVFSAAGLSYDFGVVKTSLLLQTRRDDLGLRENNAFEFGALIPLSGAQLLVDVGRFKNRVTVNADATAYSVRYDYFLSKRTTAYAGIATIRNDANATFGLNGATSAALAVKAGNDPRAVIAGIRHMF